MAGRSVADAIRNLFVLALLIGVGSLIGFRFHAAFSWTFALLGLLVRDPESAGIGGLHVWQALAWITSLLLVTIPAAVLRYRHTTAT